MPELVAHPFDDPLAARLAGPPASGVRLYWLGQAGFVIEMAGYRLVIDPYLSDSLADKYRGREFSHERMMSAPVSVDELGHVDLVLSTHHHTDHMDAETLRPLFASRDGLLLVAPAASATAALQRSGLTANRLRLVDAGTRTELLPGLFVTATRAAHETLERNEQGQHRFLGYLIEAGALRVWHSGDCVPFDGQADEVHALRPHLALLPVNGRDPALSAKGIAGNFTIAEAIATAESVQAEAMIAHHYGMFAFNTADPDEIDRAAQRALIPVERAQTGTAYNLSF